jgi:hypothetical protein
LAQVALVDRVGHVQRLSPERASPQRRPGDSGKRDPGAVGDPTSSPRQQLREDRCPSNESASDERPPTASRLVTRSLKRGGHCPEAGDWVPATWVADRHIGGVPGQQSRCAHAAAREVDTVGARRTSETGLTGSPCDRYPARDPLHYLLGIVRPVRSEGFAASEFLTSGTIVPVTVARPSRTHTGFLTPPRLNGGSYRLLDRGPWRTCHSVSRA